MSVFFASQVLCLPCQCFQLLRSFNHDDPYRHEFNASPAVSVLGDSVSVLGDPEFAEFSFPSIVLWSPSYFVLCCLPSRYLVVCQMRLDDGGYCD